MANTIPFTIENARIRPEKRDVLNDLIGYLYQRRSLAHVDTWDQIRHGEEIVQYVRDKSEVYRTLSQEGKGPLLFELGYFQVDGDRLQVVSNALPDPHPRALVRVLSEFLMPDAILQFEMEDGPRTWEIRGVDDIVKVQG